MSAEETLSGAAEALANGDWQIAQDHLDLYAEWRKNHPPIEECDRRWRELEERLKPHLNAYWDGRAEASGIS